MDRSESTDANRYRAWVSEDREDRLLAEIREMKWHIQATCTEEIQSSTQKLMMELRREVRLVMERLPQGEPQQEPPSWDDAFSEAGMFLGTVRQSLRTPPSGRSLAKGSAYRMRATRKGIATGPDLVLEGSSYGPSQSSSFQLSGPWSCPGSPRQVPQVPNGGDPRCPLAALGEPPLLRMEGEPPPHPPEIDRLDHGRDHGREGTSTMMVSALNRSRPIMRMSENPRDFTESRSRELAQLSRTSSASEAFHGEVRATLSGRRKLSLSVDTSRWRPTIKGKVSIWQMSAHDLLSSTKFDNFIGLLIMLNALTIGIQTDYAAEHVTDIFPEVFQIVERIFLGFFSCELALRLYVHKVRFFCGQWRSLLWNYFDFFIIIAQIIEETLKLIADKTNMSNNVNADQIRILRIMRILRIVRILRVIRVLHLISELRTIVSSIIGSFKSLAWTVVLLLLMIYIVSVYFTQAITEHRVELRRANQTANANVQSLEYYFNSLPRTILSLWQAMSGGTDWDTLAWPLTQEVGIVTGMMFAAYIAFALLALMNVVTGVFVQTALQSAKDEEDAFLVDQVLKLFKQRDGEDVSMISLQQIQERLSDPSVAAEWRSINVTPTEAEYLFSLLDIEEAGEVSFQEFLSGCLRLHGQSKSMDVLTVMQEARSSMRNWRMTSDNWTEIFSSHSEKLQAILDGVSNCASLLASVSRDAEIAAKNQDKIGRIEKRIRAFEGSMCSVRIAASNLSKVNEFIDTVLSPAPSPTASQTTGEEASVAGIASSQLGSLCTIDEV